MKGIAGVVLLALCTICAMLGLTVGITMNPQSTVRYVWDWGVAGGWVSGLGAMLAVGFALLQSHKQQMKEMPKVSVIHRFSPDEWLVRVVSEGVVPESILAADLIIHEDGSKIDLFGFSNIAKGGRDTKLQRGDHLDVISVNRQGIRRIAEQWVAPTIARLLRNNISPGNYDFKLDKRFFDALDELFAQRSYVLIRLVSKDLVIELDAKFVSFVSEYISSTRKAEETLRIAAFSPDAQRRMDAGQYLEFGDPQA
ncbi:hypothetical protein QCBJ_13295 [Pseudomonas sp. QC2]|uniref:hypothetical protein n=1 Tax=Pseudomonas sp. QC2 TaxID=2065822 RepID=UPI000C798EFD|nr:hypothetical protein [Pseudomonas sp. QC2]PLR62849.1 hypothetical protein QCBJ_13295 [Pseudomonas sp. QC2]